MLIWSVCLIFLDSEICPSGFAFLLNCKTESISVCCHLEHASSTIRIIDIICVDLDDLANMCSVGRAENANIEENVDFLSHVAYFLQKKTQSHRRNSLSLLVMY